MADDGIFDQSALRAAEIRACILAKELEWGWLTPDMMQAWAAGSGLHDLMCCLQALRAERLAHARVRAAGARLTERWATVSSAGMICYHCGELAAYHDAAFSPCHAETCPLVAWEAALTTGSGEVGE